jgi:hypothetical protein
MDNNGMKTATPDEIITKVCEKKLQSRERMGLLRILCTLQRTVAKSTSTVKAVVLKRWMREIIRMIEKRRICRSTIIANGEGISPRIG